MTSRPAFGVLALLACTAPFAADEGVRWSCWYNDDDNRPAIACRLAAVPSPPSAPSPGADGSMDHVPPIVRDIRTNPGALAEQLILIPLHAPPLDMRMSGRLARSVMCGARPGCEVDFSPLPRPGA